MAVFKINHSKSSSKAGLKAVLNYIFDDKKSPDRAYAITGLYDGEEVSSDIAYCEFLENKKKWKNEGGRQYRHITISLPPDEKIAPEEMLDIAKEFTERAYPGHQAAITVHQNTGSLHAHIVVDSVSYIDGSKKALQGSSKDIYEKQKLCNEITKAHGLSVPQKGKHFDGRDFEEDEFTVWSKNKYRALKKEVTTSPKEIDMFKILILIVDSLLHARNFLDFIMRIQRNKWRVYVKPKHITFENTETGRRFRDKNIQDTFNSKFSKTFGTEFKLDKEHIEELLKLPEAERRVRIEKMYDEIQHDPKAHDIPDFDPAQWKRIQIQNQNNQKEEKGWVPNSSKSKTKEKTDFDFQKKETKAYSLDKAKKGKNK